MGCEARAKSARGNILVQYEVTLTSCACYQSEVTGEYTVIGMIDRFAVNEVDICTGGLEEMMLSQGKVESQQHYRPRIISRFSRPLRVQGATLEYGTIAGSWITSLLDPLKSTGGMNLTLNHIESRRIAESHQQRLLPVCGVHILP